MAKRRRKLTYCLFTTVIIDGNVIVLNTKAILLLALLAVAPLVSAQNERITIESSSWGGSYLLGDRAFLHSNIDGEPYALECVLSHTDCTELSPGKYEIDRLIPDEGSYKNCPNVAIYRIGANRLKEKPLGEYCLDYMQDYEYRSPKVQGTALTGRVVDIGGAAIPHATVILYQWHTELSPAFLQEVARFETDSFGEFSGHVPLGKYDLFVLSSWTVPAAQRITVTSQPQRITVSVSPDPDLPREGCCDATVPTVDAPITGVISPYHR